MALSQQAVVEVRSLAAEVQVEVIETADIAVVEVIVPVNQTTLNEAVNAVGEILSHLSVDDIAGLRPLFDSKASTDQLAAGLQTKADLASGKVPTQQIPSLDAAQIATGVFDIARIPIIPSQKQEISSGDLTALTTDQQADIGKGTLVTVADGTRYVYSGAGSKTSAGSYVVLADITPDWGIISNKPVTFPPTAHSHAVSDVTGLQGALDGKQALDATLTALAALTTVADRLIYATGSDTFALATLTAYARSLLAAADAPGLKTLLALVKADVGLSNVSNLAPADLPVSTAQATALGGKQTADATLSALAALSTAADQIIYATGSDAFALASLTAYGRSLLAAADAPSLKTLLALARADVGLGNVANLAPADLPVSTATTAAIEAAAATLRRRATYTAVSKTAVQAIPSGAFTKIAFDITDSDISANWDAANNWYTCPKSGVYLITGTIRPADATTAGATYSCGVYTSEADGPWHLWTAMPPGPAQRSTYAYSRLSFQAAGTKLRMFTYTDLSGGISIKSAGLQIALMTETSAT